MAFAQANGLPNFDPTALVTGEHSGVENPNMPTALAQSGITAFRTDASRQPGQYTLGAASSAPSYPSNIYYNAANWSQEVDEYNTLYWAGAPNGHCVNTSTNTCLSSPATEQDILASESTIEMRHLLGNDPRVGYAHQMNLIGPATQTVNGVTSDSGYTLLRFLDQVTAQYDSWYTVPLTPVTVSSEAKILNQQSAWAAALAAGTVTATGTAGGAMSITNSSGSAVLVPVSAPAGSTMGGVSFGTHVGLSDSGWVTVQPGATVTIDTSAIDPAVTSASSATAQVGAALSFTVTGSGSSPLTLAADVVPTGLTFTDNGDGTATLSGTPASGTAGDHTITLTATDSAGASSQTFTLHVQQAPSFISPSTSTVGTGQPYSFTVTTSGTPVASLSEDGALPSGITFTDNGDGTATLAGTPTQSGTFPLILTAHNGVGADASQALTLTVGRATPSVTWSAPAAITYGTALTGTQLDATASVPGTFTYTPAAGTVPGAGSDQLSVTFTPTDSTDYTPVTTTTNLVVQQAVPVVTWKKIKSFAYGTPLGSTQLDAKSSTPGTFTYTPGPGTVLAAGSQTLHAVFTPTDSVDYATAAVTATVSVKGTVTKTALSFTSPVTEANQSAADFMITVTPHSGSGPVAGTVDVVSGSTVLCSASVGSGGVGTCTLTAGELAPGTYSIVANYLGNANLKASRSHKGKLTVT